MDGQGVDTDVVEGVGVDRIRPGNDGGVDRTMDQEVSRNFAPKQSNSVVITFFFRWEELVIISTQENGDLTVVGGGEGAGVQSSLSRCRE